MELLLILAIIFIWVQWSIINKKWLGDVLSPFNLLFYFWVLPLLMSYLGWSELQSGLSFEATAIIVSCTLILVSISVLPMRIIRRDSGSIQGLGVSLSHMSGFTDGYFIKFTVLVFYFVSLLAMYFAEFSQDYIPIVLYYAQDTLDSGLHLVGKDSKLQVIAQGIMVAGLLCFYISISSKGKYNRYIFGLLATIVPLLGLLKASKTGVFTPVIYYFAVYYYFKKAQDMPVITLRSGLFIFGTLLVMVLITALRVEGVGANSYSSLIRFVHEDTLFYPLNEIAAIIYGYIALSFQNFSNYTDYHDGKLRLGISFFRPFLSIFMQGEYVREMVVPRSNWHFVSTAATVGTYLRGLYMEGGLLLCLFGSAIYATFVNWLYIRFRMAGGGIWMFVYIIMIFPWTWMFFQNAFSILTFHVNSFYVILILSPFYFNRKQKRPVGVML
jgi:oligosaccharide repeat unit polymerase